VVIDATLKAGHLTYGEYTKQGTTDDVVLLSSHVCHPSMCNDNLSGISLLTQLASYLESIETRYSYRVLFIPGTIGAIAWLARNEAVIDRIRHGIVSTCVGDSGSFNYKKSRRGSASIDRVVEYVLQESGHPFELREFTPTGYDERQFCSPGFNLPVGRLTRTPNGEYAEYHSSEDDLNLVRPKALGESYAIYRRVLEVLEADQTYLNTSPRGEPQLGRRGLYSHTAGDLDDREKAMFWILNLSDGGHSLLDIAIRSGIGMNTVRAVADVLVQHDLLRETV
jgi:aminopeptidase-like protein